MNTTVTANLVIWLDMSASPVPVIVDVGVYGEAHPSSTDLHRRVPVTITSSRGSTFENAVENLRRYCSSMPRMRWSLPYFPKAGA